MEAIKRMTFYRFFACKENDGLCYDKGKGIRKREKKVKKRSESHDR